MQSQPSAVNPDAEVAPPTTAQRTIAQETALKNWIVGEMKRAPNAPRSKDDMRTSCCTEREAGILKTGVRTHLAERDSGDGGHSLVKAWTEIEAAYRYANLIAPAISGRFHSACSLAFYTTRKDLSVNAFEQAPEYGRIPEACRRYGLSRSRLYLLAGDGHIRFVKVGSATLGRSDISARIPGSLPGCIDTFAEGGMIHCDIADTVRSGPPVELDLLK